MMKTFPDVPESDTPEKLTLINTTGGEIPAEEHQFSELLNLIENGENVSFREIETVFVDETEIQQINREFLDHDYVTDIITFRYDENNRQAIEGTLYCCAPRIEEQSREFGTTLKSEFMRVFVHGLLHLCGYDDSNEDDKKRMTGLENHYLNQLEGTT
jgi:probable rRNA maturation factor